MRVALFLFFAQLGMLNIIVAVAIAIAIDRDKIICILFYRVKSVQTTS